MRTLAGSVLLVVFASAAIVVLAHNVGSRDSSAMTACETVVAPGDTLWGIAARVVPGADPRQTLEVIIRLNDLQSPRIRPGQRLLVPGRQTALRGDLTTIP